MTPPPTKDQVFALANAAFQTCQRVHDFVGETVRPIVDRTSPTTEEERTYLGGLLRAHAWLRSLNKLNHPGDFQAVAAGARSLYEIAVDNTLLLLHPDESWEKMKAWEESTKFKASQALVRFFVQAGEPLPSVHSPSQAFVKTEALRVKALRDRYWGGSHPPSNRWTGRDLRTDAVRADALEPAGLTRFYDTRYRMLCWDTHGSALLTVRNLDERLFPGLTAQAFRDASEMGLRTAELILRLVDEFDPITQVRFGRFRELCELEMHEFLAPLLNSNERRS